MSELFLGSNLPVATQVAGWIKALIASRRLRRGDALPPYRELAAKYDVAFLTVKRAMDALAKEGLVQAVPPKGVFVKKALAIDRKRPLTCAGMIYPESNRYLFATGYMSEILRGIMVESQSSNDVRLFSMFQEGPVLADRIAESHVDGVLLVGLENDEYLCAFATWGTPGVVLDYVMPDVPLDCVACDNRTAASRAVEHLRSLGHRRILCLGPEPALSHQVGRDGRQVLVKRSSDVRERRAEVERAATAAGAEFTAAIFPPAGRGVPAGAAAVIALLRGARPPTAILTYDDQMSAQVLACLDAHGISAPEAVSLCALAGAGEVLHKGRAITRCRFDFMGMGRKGVELLRRRCLRPEPGRRRVYRIGFEFVEGQTTARLRKR